MGGCFTASRLVDILQTVPLTNISFEAQHGLNLIDADVIIYTQVSAGLVIALGILCLLFAVPITLRVCKINVDSVNCRRIILFVVSCKLQFDWSLQARYLFSRLV